MTPDEQVRAAIVRGWKNANETIDILRHEVERLRAENERCGRSMAGIVEKLLAVQVDLNRALDAAAAVREHYEGNDLHHTTLLKHCIRPKCVAARDLLADHEEKR